MIKISYQLANGIILVPATANGQKGVFAFDTGAMQTAINKAYFTEIDGERIDIAKFSEEVKESIADKGILNTLRISDIERSNIPVLIMDLMYVENVLKGVLPDLKLLGTLGIDVIGAYSVMLDYNASEIILNPTYEFENQISVPLKHEKLPIIQIEISSRQYDFVLDTGANTCLLGQSFRKEQFLVPAHETPNIVTIPTLRVGENEYQNTTAVISDISAIQKRVAVEGVIGYQILSQQRSVLDFKNQMLIMEKV